jgi:hypothetical protein
MNSRVSKTVIVTVLLALAVLAVRRPALAWWSGGHKAITLAAVSKMPADVPQFFRDAGAELSEMSTEPDNWKNKTVSHLQKAEEPEHYIDLEYLGDDPIPQYRFELLKYYFSKNIEPAKGGLLPCAIQEGYERLLLAFRVYRSQPDSELVKKQIIVYAGWVAHYCEDCAMPLHTTKDFDGRHLAGGTVEQKGIHARIDSYPEKNGITPEMIGEGLVPADAVNVWAVILDAIKKSHAEVDPCYKLDADGAFDRAPENGKALMLQCTRNAAKLTADIWYSAWKNSDPARATVK